MNSNTRKKKGIISRLKIARFLWKLMLVEAHSPARLPLKDSLWGWRHGFLRSSVILYGLTPENYTGFLNDINRYCKTPFVNGEFSCIFDNKITFERFLHQFPGLVPENYFVRQYRLMMPTNSKYLIKTEKDVIDLIYELGGIVIKPFGGSLGLNINIIRYTGGQLFHNNKPTTPEALTAFIKKSNNILGCELVQQAEYARRIFPDSTNTIRVLTMWDFETNRPFIASAVHRFGNKATAPVDNFQQGGLSAYIDLESGAMGKAKPSLYKAKKAIYTSVHPDTGAQIEGIAIPDWETVKSTILNITNEMSFAPYVGWDVVKTQNGIKILEGNSHSGVLTIQTHIPLLKDPRVRAFYQYHGVI